MPKTKKVTLLDRAKADKAFLQAAMAMSMSQYLSDAEYIALTHAWSTVIRRGQIS